MHVKCNSTVWHPPPCRTLQCVFTVLFWRKTPPVSRCSPKPSRYTFVSAPCETMPSLQASFHSSLWKVSPSESMTKELIPHNVTIFPCIKEVTLRYWNQHRTTCGSPFYLGEIKGSRGLPTNNHLAPSLVWFGLAWWRQSWVFTARNRTGSSLHHIKKQLKICQHLQTFEKSSSKSLRAKLTGSSWDRSRPLLRSYIWGFHFSACLSLHSRARRRDHI